eukprot:1572014-Prymnesium_polylepis.1
MPALERRWAPQRSTLPCRGRVCVGGARVRAAQLITSGAAACPGALAPSPAPANPARTGSRRRGLWRRPRPAAPLGHDDGRGSQSTTQTHRRQFSGGRARLRSVFRCGCTTLSETPLAAPARASRRSLSPSRGTAGKWA